MVDPLKYYKIIQNIDHNCDGQFYQKVDPEEQETGTNYEDNALSYRLQRTELLTVILK